MRIAWILLICAALSATSPLTMADAMSDAFSQGGDLGNGQTNSTFSGINTATEQTNIPSFGASTSTQSGYYGGGDGNIETPGAAEISTCANAAPSSDPMANQYCNAVNFLATNPGVRPQMTISPNDSLMLNAKAISQNANAILQSNGISTAGTTSQCVPTTTTTPAQYTTEMCTTAQGLTTTQCVMGRVVNITDNTNYQCNQTVNAYQTQTCNKVLTVAVTALSQCSQTGVVYSGAAACASSCATNAHAIVESIYQGRGGNLYYMVPGYNGAYPVELLSTAISNFSIQFTMSLAQIESLITAGTKVKLGVYYAYGHYGYPQPNYSTEIFYNVKWAAPGICTDVSTTTDSWSDQCATLEAESQ